MGANARFRTLQHALTNGSKESSLKYNMKSTEVQTLGVMAAVYTLHMR